MEDVVMTSSDENADQTNEEIKIPEKLVNGINIKFYSMCHT